MAAAIIPPVPEEGFWADFWNTLYQFTHPLSSTFFDTLFEDLDRKNAEAASASASTSSASATVATTATPVQPQATATAPTPPPGSRYFSDKDSFEKFWRQLHNNDEVTGEPSGFYEISKTVWTDIVQSVTGFTSAIDWQQTWIQMIFALHIVTFSLIIAFRNRPNALAAMLFCTIIFAALSEPLNSVGSRHWSSFSTDNYFDTHGVFISVVWATPQIGNACVAVILLLRATAKMLIKVKKAQLQNDRRKQHKKQK